MHVAGSTGLAVGKPTTRSICPSLTSLARPRSISSHNKRGSVLITCNSNSPQRGLSILEWTGKLLPQGQLVKTAKYGWRELWRAFMRELAPQSKDGSYTRPTYTLQNKIGDPDFPAEPGRYVLYLGNPCPWCHRVSMAVALKGLEGSIQIIRAIDDPERASRGGWVFNDPEPAFGCRDLREVYDACTPGGYRGRCTAPLLVDTLQRRIVCNESAVITRNLNSARFPGAAPIDLCPAALEKDIVAWNERTYESVNNGVYKCGFSTTQAAYNMAVSALFSELAALDTLLGTQRFLCGDRFTEADLRLFPTIVRFDAVYTGLFKCSERRLSEYQHLHAWLMDCAGLPLHNGGVLVDTVDVDDCRRSYYSQLFPLNPGGIVPIGPTAASLGLKDPPARGPRDTASVYHEMINAPPVNV